MDMLWTALEDFEGFQIGAAWFPLAILKPILSISMLRRGL